jgi:hypothetical protein
MAPFSQEGHNNLETSGSLADQRPYSKNDATGARPVASAAPYHGSIKYGDWTG